MKNQTMRTTCIVLVCLLHTTLGLIHFSGNTIKDFGRKQTTYKFDNHPGLSKVYVEYDQASDSVSVGLSPLNGVFGKENGREQHNNIYFGVYFSFGSSDEIDFVVGVPNKPLSDFGLYKYNSQGMYGFGDKVKSGELQSIMYNSPTGPVLGKPDLEFYLFEFSQLFASISDNDAHYVQKGHPFTFSVQAFYTSDQLQNEIGIKRNTNMIPRGAIQTECDPELIDVCGECEGDLSCIGCDGVAHSGLVMDGCGVCGGRNRSCSGCDGIPYSDACEDECGVCNGDGSSCADCDGVPNGPNPPNECGRCDGQTPCIDCFGCVDGGAVRDECGVCGGDGSTCRGCDGELWGDCLDMCGDCGGDNGECLGCNDIPLAANDTCGECSGDSSSCECVFYRDYHTVHLDCLLLEASLTETISEIEQLLVTLHETHDSLLSPHGNDGRYNPILADEILLWDSFEQNCLSNYCGEIGEVISGVKDVCGEF
eukprot:TRINITY_DN1833_c0_g1_i1.p1 TRINITY_DN1833_c0_g1~~TRINITY_DN1833_c0_g1_i1.p1  ORF type:complete len:480 (-),score=53.14 TRINITY_DN1833_c0_g1_i1:49-1488(-)